MSYFYVVSSSSFSFWQPLPISSAACICLCFCDEVRSFLKAKSCFKAPPFGAPTSPAQPLLIREAQSQTPSLALFLCPYNLCFLSALFLSHILRQAGRAVCS